MRTFFGNLLALARPYRVRLALGIGLGVLAGLADLLVVLAVGLVFAVVFPQGGKEELARQLGKFPLFVQELPDKMDHWFHFSGGVPTAWKILAVSAIPLAILIRGTFTYLNNYCLQWVGVRALTRLRNQLFAHLNTLSLGFFHQTSTGELMSRVTNDIATLQNAIGSNLATLVKEPVTIVTLAVYLFSQQARLTLLVLLVFPLCIIPIVFYARKVRKASSSIQEQFGELSRVMEEPPGNRIVKAYNLEQPVQRQFEAASTRFVHHYMRVIRSLELPGTIIEFVGSLGVACIFLYIVLGGGSTGMAVPELVKFVGSIFLLYRPVKSLTRLYHSLVQSRAASERVFEILALRPVVAEPARPLPLRASGADLHFDRVTFTYDQEKRAVLQEFNLRVKTGQMVALVGQSGAGKTTVTNLLLRFYDPTSGSVKIGNTDLRDVSFNNLRAQMAVVTQETVLFNDTIRYNIELGRPGATFAEIQEAARHAHALDFILDKPSGFDTIIGERGVTLSGGQRQRVAIARAILRDAPILILDEATSSLDTESERAVQTALDELMQGRTTLCIAHRLSTIQRADIIVVMEHGRIVEMGRHTELLQNGGVYQRLYSLQFHA